jgi:RNA-directed DNA polymerase
MNTYRNLYPQVHEFENLFRAYRSARRGKRSKESVAAFERRQEQELLRLQDELIAKTYQPGPYDSFYIHEPKRRLISAAPFRDRVAHHALCQVIEPIWERRFIFDSYANRVGKGTHRALDRAQEFTRRYRYVLQCDIRQFFPSIDIAILRSEISRLIADPDVLWLCDQILAPGHSVLPEDYQMAWFVGDDLLAALRPRGLPIGNLTSQFWANVYLNPLDQFIKRELGSPGEPPAYLRYVDDFLLFADEKAILHAWRQAVIEYLAGLRLVLHESRAQVYPCEVGIPYLGFRVYPDHRRVKARKVINFRQKLKVLTLNASGRPGGWLALKASIQGWVNHVRYADSWGLRRTILGEVRL